jgi:FkbM family methyltransferase
MKSGLQRLYANGVRPRLLFDVGAHQGEFAVEFRSVFPGCSIACFEAIPACVASLRTLAETSAGVSVYPTLLGSQIKPGVPFFQLEGPAETASSVLGGWDPSVQPSAVYPMTTLDASSELHGARPDFIKLDVQGFELSVLEGGEETLRTAEVLLAEANVLELYKGAPLLAELVAWLEKRGWVVYDILTTIRRPLDDALWQSDFVFVPKSSPLRADMRYVITSVPAA